MSRKIFILIIAIIVVGGIVWAYSATRTPSPSSGTAGSSSGLSTLFPFIGSGGAAPTTPTDTQPKPSEPGTPTKPAASTPSNLLRISDRTVAGFTILAPGSASPARITHSAGNATDSASSTPILTPAPAVRFVEAGTGYVYDTDAIGTAEKKQSSTLIARAAEAIFADGGKSVAIRYIKPDNLTVATFLAAVTLNPDGTSVGSLVGQFLPDNIVDIVPSPDQKSFFYIAKTASGSIGITITTANTNRKQILSSPFSEWLAGWSARGQIVTAKAASGIPGYAYSVTSTGNLQKIIGGVNCLTTLMSPDGKTLLYSASENGGLHLYALHLAAGTNTDLNLATLPEKCAWSKDSVTVYCGAQTSLSAGVYPDAWYQGISHFNDSLWRINTTTGLTSELMGEQGNYLDATHLALDLDERYLVFINRNDGTLWSLDLLGPKTN